jgi:hypothetical protein
VCVCVLCVCVVCVCVCVCVRARWVMCGVGGVVEEAGTGFALG